MMRADSNIEDYEGSSNSLVVVQSKDRTRHVGTVAQA